MAALPVEVLPNTMLLESMRRGLRVRPLKLQKLMYFACGEFAALAPSEEKAVREWWLLPNNFFAWPNGPVEREVYGYYKKYGYDYIGELMGKGRYFKRTEPNKDITEALDATLSRYGALDDMALSDITHQRGGPWEQARNDENWNGQRPYPEMHRGAIYKYFKDQRA